MIDGGSGICNVLLAKCHECGHLVFHWDLRCCVLVVFTVVVCKTRTSHAATCYLVFMVGRPLSTGLILVLPLPVLDGLGMGVFPADEDALETLIE